jgi:hypothetical protein
LLCDIKCVQLSHLSDLPPNPIDNIVYRVWSKAKLSLSQFLNFSFIQTSDKSAFAICCYAALKVKEDAAAIMNRFCLTRMPRMLSDAAAQARLQLSKMLQGAR